METSPLTRGKPTKDLYKQACHGNIPAHAGKTCVACSVIACSRKHPRSRGENCVNGKMKVKFLETSPLTRGKLSAILNTRTIRRNIPAHAGKTGSLVAGCSNVWKHPRSRGENIPCWHAICRYRETSPLTRGKLATIVASRGRTQKHPRSRGENINILTAFKRNYLQIVKEHL